MNKIEYGTEFLDQLKDSVHDLYDENKELKKEIERLNNIIKEVRKKIESVQMLGLRSGKTFIATLLNDILEILDKVGDDK